MMSRFSTASGVATIVAWCIVAWCIVAVVPIAALLRMSGCLSTRSAAVFAVSTAAAGAALLFLEGSQLFTFAVMNLQSFPQPGGHWWGLFAVMFVANVATATLVGILGRRSRNRGEP